MSVGSVKKWTGAVLTLVAAFGASMAFGGGTFGSGTAHAASCPSGYFCAWQYTGFGGMRYEHYALDDDWPSYIDDNEDSIKNSGNSGYPVQVYDAIWRNDPHYCIRSGVEVSNIPDHKDGDGASHQWASNPPSAPCF